MAEKEYIDRQAAIEKIRYQGIYGSGYSNEEREDDVVDMIDSIPAADVRPVVLCRDCRWYQIDELKKDGTEDRRYKPSVCVLAGKRRDQNYFCADGEKREES